MDELLSCIGWIRIEAVVDETSCLIEVHTDAGPCEFVSDDVRRADKGIDAPPTSARSAVSSARTGLVYRRP